MESTLTIVMYHYVRDLINSRYPEIKGLDVESFINQIDYLRKHYTIIKAEDVINHIELNEKLPPKSVLLTFDDGYIDHYTTVFPILSNYGLQGSFYIPAKAIKENELLDVNRIHFILAATTDKRAIVNDLQKLISDYREEYKLETFDYYYQKLAVGNRFDNAEVIFIKRLLQVELVEELRLKFVGILFLKYVGIEEHIFARELYMTKEQIIHMQRSGMHIGSHGYNHYWWNHLNHEELTEEIDKSMDFLTEVGVDMNSWTACYPYGSVDQKAVDMLNLKGCKFALTTEVNLATPTIQNRQNLARLDTNDLPKMKNSEVNSWFYKQL